MKIGFYGGSFDPPHRGHIALAELAMERLGLERVLLAPVGVQPLKRDRPLAGFEDRVAMTRLAIEGHAGLELSLIDAPRADGRANYTTETIAELRRRLKPQDRIYCLMGADSFLSIGQWYRAAELLLACDFVVASRPGFDLGRLASALPANVSLGACDHPHPEALTMCLLGGGRESRLYLLTDFVEPVSASEIRAALHRGGEPGEMLNGRVAAYIREHGLYREETVF
jgi:nicotinate-nucleotide adenylyltransferase